MSTVESMSTTERFLQYVAFDTQSVRESTTAPSAEKELALAAFLVDELKALGVEDARIGEGGVVYGSIPATPPSASSPTWTHLPTPRARTRGLRSCATTAAT